MRGVIVGPTESDQSYSFEIKKLPDLSMVELWPTDSSLMSLATNQQGNISAYITVSGTDADNDVQFKSRYDERIYLWAIYRATVIKFSHDQQQNNAFSINFRSKLNVPHLHHHHMISISR